MNNPDQQIFWEYAFVKLNLTIVTTWGLMLVMVIAAWLATRRLSTGIEISWWQSLLEIIVINIRDQIAEVGISRARTYLPFLGTLFVFIAFAALCNIFPAYVPPTSSLSTTVALALCVFLAVPAFGISESGLGRYLKTYLEPTFLMLPFNIISEISRTIALAIRLFGNMMSGVMIISILLSIAPFFFPILLNVLGLLTGIVQAYIFFILATVFTAAAIREGEEKEEAEEAGYSKNEKNNHNG